MCAGRCSHCSGAKQSRKRDPFANTKIFGVYCSSRLGQSCLYGSEEPRYTTLIRYNPYKYVVIYVNPEITCIKIRGCLFLAWGLRSKIICICSVFYELKANSSRQRKVRMVVRSDYMEVTTWLQPSSGQHDPPSATHHPPRPSCEGSEEFPLGNL